MLDAIQAVHVLPVLVATLAYYMLGALWFTPLFGQQYDTAAGISRAPNQKWAPRYYLIPLLSCALISLATAILIEALIIDALTDTLLLGLVIGIGHLGALSLAHALTPHIPHPYRLAAIVGGYHLCGALLSALIYGWLG